MYSQRMPELLLMNRCFKYHAKLCQEPYLLFCTVRSKDYFVQSICFLSSRFNCKYLKYIVAFFFCVKHSICLRNKCGNSYGFVLSSFKKMWNLLHVFLIYRNFARGYILQLIFFACQFWQKSSSEALYQIFFAFFTKSQIKDWWTCFLSTVYHVKK